MTMCVTYDMFAHKIVFDYEEYVKNNIFKYDNYFDWFDPNNYKQNVEDLLGSLEGFRLEIPNKDEFYIWQSNGVDVVEFKVVENFDKDMCIMLEREKKYYLNKKVYKDDLFGIPGMRMYEDNIVQNGYKINVKHYNPSYDIYCDGSFGYRLISFHRIKKS